MHQFKKLLENYLGRLVKRFFAKHPDTRLITVSGSVGKTSTKEALATILGRAYRIRASRGNLNATLSAPLEILGIDGPTNNRSPLDWLRVIRRARKAVRAKQAPEIIIQEIGIDCPGEMATFARYMRPDIALITAITPEHMEQFGDLDTVAHEELLITKRSLTTIYNLADISPEQCALIESPERITYGSAEADYHLTACDFSLKDGFSCQLIMPDSSLAASVHLLGEHSLRAIAGAAAAAESIGMTPADITESIKNIQPVAGRMNPLHGKNGALLVDDSYNSSPAAVKSALETLYSLPYTRKIAVLGSMNELGDTSDEAHQQVGELCDPAHLELVIVVGEQAAKHLAPAAEKNGCIVEIITSAIKAGEFLTDKLDDQTAVLIKGSQGDIYLEEATKLLLKNPSDSGKLVRQSKSWLETKQKFFARHD